MTELSINQQKEIIEVLSSYGLKEKEQTVYLAILKSGPTTTTPLATSLGLPVTTVESILRRLYNEGLLNITKRKSRHVYEALDPVAFKHILTEKISEVTKIIPLLQELTKDKTSKTKIRVFYRERLSEIFSEALRCKNKIIYEIVAAKDLQMILGEKFHFSRRRIEKNIHLKSLRVENQEIKKYSRHTHQRELREAKFLPRELTFNTNVFFWDNTVAIFSAHSEGAAVVIESPSIKNMFSQIFEMIWSVSRTMETAN